MKRLALMLAAASLAAPAAAQSPSDQPRSITVSVSGVRFDDSSSIANLSIRIARAVRQVCEPYGITLRDRLSSRQCELRAAQQSERQLAQLVDRTRLAAVSLGTPRQ